MTHTVEQVPVHEAPITGAHPTRAPRRSRRLLLGWAVIAVGGAAAAALTLQAITSETEPTTVEPPVVPAQPSLVGVPMSADAAERYLAAHGATRPLGVPGSADAAERYLAGLKAR